MDKSTIRQLQTKTNQQCVYRLTGRDRHTDRREAGITEGCFIAFNHSKEIADSDRIPSTMDEQTSDTK